MPLRVPFLPTVTFEIRADGVAHAALRHGDYFKYRTFRQRICCAGETPMRQAGRGLFGDADILNCGHGRTIKVGTPDAALMRWASPVVAVCQGVEKVQMDFFKEV